MALNFIKLDSFKVVDLRREIEKETWILVSQKQF